MLQKINLIDFRNYESFEMNLVPEVNVILGKNSAGKTNILESVYLLCVGDSFRARKTEEMIRFGADFAQVRGEIKVGEEIINEEIVLTRGTLMGKTVNKRKYLINGASKRKNDVVGMQKMVIFRPEDVDLVAGSSDNRRKFLDRILSQVIKGYISDLASYEQALKRRNKILSAIREGQMTAYSLTFWNGLLIKYGNTIQNQRLELVTYINDLFLRSDLFSRLSIKYEASTMTEERLAEHFEVEKIVGHTMIGPHKDDWSILDMDRDLDDFGSRGEQRMAVLACKMGEIYFLERSGKDKVLLLLDDVFSELDDEHKNEVLRLIPGRQVIATMAVESDSELFDKAEILRL